MADFEMSVDLYMGTMRFLQHGDVFEVRWDGPMRREWALELVRETARHIDATTPTINGGTMEEFMERLPMMRASDG